MKIGVVDADLIGRKRHRFPNLACMKISGHYKSIGADVELLTDYRWCPSDFDAVYVSKVFSDTVVPTWVHYAPNVVYGGTGYTDPKIRELPYHIEHAYPDYHLYDNWIFDTIDKNRTTALKSGRDISEKAALREFRYYTDYSIGFLTRGCNRRCPWCVNKNSKGSTQHSLFYEFLDKSRPLICLLDDNFLQYSDHVSLLRSLKQAGKGVEFKQGLDIRLLSDHDIDLLIDVIHGEFIFAFDNISDFPVIRDKLSHFRCLYHPKSRNIQMKCYVLSGYPSQSGKDLIRAFKRVQLLFEWNVLPYIMNYRPLRGEANQSPEYKHLYVALARWCNQPAICKKMSFREFCETQQKRIKSGRICEPCKAFQLFEQNYPNESAVFFDMRFGDPLKQAKRVKT